MTLWISICTRPCSLILQTLAQLLIQHFEGLEAWNAVKKNLLLQETAKVNQGHKTNSMSRV